jgi:hypothetical protein
MAKISFHRFPLIIGFTAINCLVSLGEFEMKMLLFLPVFLLCCIARAEIFVEPSLGYQIGNYSATPVGSTSQLQASDNGLGIGLRAAYGFMGAFVGLDYDMSFTQLISTSSNYSNNTPAQHSTAYLSGGYAFPLLFRVFAGYGFSDTLSVNGGSGSSAGGSTETGTAFKLGVSYSFLPLLSLNLTYISHNFTQLNSTTTGTLVSGGISIFYSQLSMSAFMLSASLPYSF